ncbi:MAG: hypothetical protein H6559_21520 [Lewinellaceae bacterium]|nr:hypothetical protein [Lewinellaceae bacterium]
MFDKPRKEFLLGDYFNNVGSVLYMKNKNFARHFGQVDDFKAFGAKSDIDFIQNITDEKFLEDYCPSFSAYLYY